MGVDIHAKLVRDKIPYIIRQNGEEAHYRKLEYWEYREALKQKLVEEAMEVAAAKNTLELIKELADLLEVFYALLKAYRFPLRTVEHERRQRAFDRGAFVARIFLLWTGPKEARRRGRR